MILKKCAYVYLIFGAKTTYAIPKLFFRMGKRTRGEMESEDELVEKHDGVFAGPLMMFPTFPHNITFEESRETIIQANPTDDDAETYTFIHNRQEFGILRTEDATISANIQLVAPTGIAIANTEVVGVMLKPLVLGWKTKEVYVNNDVINPTSTHESELQYINYLLTQSPTGTKDKEGLYLGYRDTPGNFDNSVGFNNGTNVVNNGGEKRAIPFRISAVRECRDHLDILGHNRRYVPTSYDIKIVLHRIEKTKFLHGTAAHCIAARVLLKDLKLTIPMMKPVTQLSEAINELMIQRANECKYYVTNYRYVAKPLAIGAQYVHHTDIFNGSRPTHVICYQKSQARYNGDHTLNTNRLIFPDINYFQVKINEASIPPLITTAQESYTNLVRVLDHRHSEMPFSYEEYATDYGVIVVDLTANKDSHNQVLPNSTAAVVSVDIKYNQALVAPQQLIYIGEFRNQLSIGYKSAARLKYEF